MPLLSPPLVTEFDRRRLEAVLQLIRRRASAQVQGVDALRHELSRARVIPSEAVPADVVTMNSRVELIDLHTGERVQRVLTFPSARSEPHAVSVLSPLGLRLLGARVGDELVLATQAGERKLRIHALLYQPESLGNYQH